MQRSASSLHHLSRNLLPESLPAISNHSTILVVRCKREGNRSFSVSKISSPCRESFYTAAKADDSSRCARAARYAGVIAESRINRSGVIAMQSRGAYFGPPLDKTTYQIKSRYKSGNIEIKIKYNYCTEGRFGDTIIIYCKYRITLLQREVPIYYHDGEGAARSSLFIVSSTRRRRQ